MPNARDYFWLWCHEPGAQNEGWGLPGKSRITAVEAAFYMGIMNVIMVKHKSGLLPPDWQYVVPFRNLDRVVWSVVGAGGAHDDEQTARALEIPNHLDNMTGIMLDDFFTGLSEQDRAGVMPVEKLQALRKRMDAVRKLDTWVVVYDHQINLPLGEHLKICDKATFWTWEAKDLVNLEGNFDKFEQLVPPNCGKVLGCYMWDYGGQKAMPMDVMKKQVEMGWKWLREGRIEGIIFLASAICDLDIDTVEWTRQWVVEVGNERIGEQA